MDELKKVTVRETTKKIIESIQKAMAEEPKSAADIESMLYGSPKYLSRNPLMTWYGSPFVRKGYLLMIVMAKVAA
jgi:hypothetical protein